MRKRLFYSILTSILGYFIYYNRERSGKTSIINLLTISISMAMLSLLLEHLVKLCHKPVTNFFKQAKNNVMFFKTSVTTFLNGQFPFSDLPLELQCKVIYYLNKETRISLGNTSRYFNSVINNWGRIYNSEDYRKKRLTGTIVTLENKRIADYFTCLSTKKFRLFYKDDWQGYQKKLEEKSLVQLINNYRLGYESYFDIFSSLLYLLIVSVKMGVNTEINATAQNILFKALYSFIENENVAGLSGELLIRRLIKATYDISSFEYHMMQFNAKDQQEFIQNSLRQLVKLFCNKFHYDPKLIEADDDRKLLLALDEVTAETNHLA